MLLTNWLRSIACKCRPARPRFVRNQRSRALQRFQSVQSQRAKAIEQLEDRTMLTSVISIDDVTGLEGNSYNVKTDFIFTVTRTGATSGDLNQDVVINFTTQDGTATIQGNPAYDDYITQNGTIVFSADPSALYQSKSIVIKVKRDFEVELDQYFQVILSSDSLDIIFDKNVGIGTILNDDIKALEESGRIRPPSPSVIGDHFGNAIAIDGNFMVVGAIDSDLIKTDAGAAYVYFRNRQNTLDNEFDDTWEYQTTLTAFDGSEGDQFGSSVAIARDTIVIGAYADDDLGSDSGSAYIYRWDGFEWVFEEKLIASNGRLGDNFGGDVSIEDDIIVVGASFYNPDDPEGPFDIQDAGAAYVFTRNGSDWSETQLITASNAAVSDQFGWEVIIQNNTIFISGLKSDTQDSNSNAGAVYIFHNLNGTWTEQQILTHPDGETYDFFGYDIDVDGNFLGVITAAGDEDRRNAYIFENIDGNWQFKQSLGTPGYRNNPSANSISISGSSIAIGSIESNGNSNNTGVVYIYHHKELENWWSESQELFTEFGSSNDYFGYAVAFSDSQLIVGAPRSPISTINAGQIYTFQPYRPHIYIDLPFGARTEGDSGETSITFNIFRISEYGRESLDFESTIQFRTIDGTATVADGDYQYQSGTITFKAIPIAIGQIERITLIIYGDEKFEGMEDLENFFLQITDDSFTTSLISEEAEIRIFDDDYAILKVTNITVEEDVGVALVEVSLNNALDTAISVDFVTSDISALDTSDYVPTSGTLVFAPGVLTKTIAIPLVNSDQVEGDETFSLNLSNLQTGGYLLQIDNNPAIITIRDDDDASISISDITVNEEETTATLTVSLDQLVDTNVTVEFSTADNTATTSDYLATSGSLTFNPGEQSKTINISLVDNSLLENVETFFVNLTNIQANGANIYFADDQALVSILDNDHASVSINNVSVNENEGTAILTVSLDQPLETIVSVDFVTADQSSTNPDDYLSTSGTLTFTPGEQSKTIPVSITDDSIVEMDKTFLVDLRNLISDNPNVIIGSSQAEVTIHDDDQASVSIDDVIVDETAGTASLTISLNKPVATTVNIDFGTASQSASDPDDYVAQSGTLTFNPGEQSKTITIDIVDSDLVEIDETFLVNLTTIQANGANLIFTNNQAKVTIQDNDQAKMSISDLSVNENIGTATITVTLDQPVDAIVAIDYATADQSATNPDDYLSTSGTLIFTPGEQSKTITVSIVNSELVESDERFFVNLINLQANGRNVILAENQAEVTILDDDQASISINDLSIDEAAGTAILTVTLDKPIDTSISIDFTTADQTAVVTDDYQSQSGTLIFNAGEQTKTITVSIVDTNLVEADEIFLVNLFNLQANGAAVIVADNQSEVTITDDDQANVSINDAIVDESAGTVTLTVSLDQPLTFPVSVDFMTANQTAIVSDDYLAQSGTLIFNAGEQTQTITISLVDSDYLETNETFLVNLTNIQANGAKILFADNQAQVTILDDDIPLLSISDLTVNETDGMASITVSLDHPVDTTVSIDYLTADQTALNSTDYLFQSGTLTFDPGEQSKTIDVEILDNDIVEGFETFLVKLRNLQTTSPDVILADDQAIITIVDDDQATFSIEDVTVDETAETVKLKVSLNRAVYSTVYVDYATADNTASHSTDYTSQTGTLTFTRGQQSKYITIPLIDFDSVESIESFFVNLTNIQANGAQVTFADDQAEITILDDDQADLTIDDVTVDEAAGTATITVTLEQPVESIVSVDFATVDQTAFAPDDYLATAGTLTFNPGEQSKTITVSLINSDLVEIDETFLINLTNIQANGANILLADDQAIVTISDDDLARFSINDISVDENAGTATLTVSLDQPVDTEVSVNFATANQSAFDPDDYLAATGTLNFAQGEQSKTITISLTDSTLVEVDELFLVNLTNIQSNGRNVIFADSQAEVTIIDDELASAEVNLRVVNSPSNTQPSGETSSLPANVDWIGEWSSYWVEIWVDASSPTDQGVFSVALDLSYNTDYTSATQIEFGAGFAQNQLGSINDLSGTIQGLSAETNLSDLGSTSYLLFARIKFEPLADDQVSLDFSGKSIGPYDLGFSISSQQVNLVGDVPVTTNLGLFNGVNIWANPYDLNDDDRINFRDLSQFVSVYNTIPSQSTSDFSWIADLNQNDRVDFRDLVSFVANYGRNKVDLPTIFYPQNFPETWNNPLIVDTQSEPQSNALSVTQSAAETVLDSVVEQISPQLTAGENEKLQSIDIQVIDLEDDMLGRAVPGTIYIDVNAAGYGWFVDTTPGDQNEFTYASQLTLIALPDSAAAGRVDLWSVILHEIGHLLGHDHTDEGVMQDTLAPGVRKLSSWEINFEYENHSTPEETDSFFFTVQDETDLAPF
tara:strand:- start:92664 stop:99785 length:7122 start_codon:yes stop_codon:yes gene_type:complete